MNLLQQFEKEQVDQLTANNPVPVFAPGDTIRAHIKVVEGNKQRIQIFEGICIGRRNASINSAVTLRKIASGEAVERVFPLFSPLIRFERIRRGSVRRAKLYYLRNLSGRKAKIAEKSVHSLKQKNPNL